MKIPRPLANFILHLTLGGSLALGVLLDGCATTGTRDSNGKYLADSVVTRQIKRVLRQDPQLKAFVFSVATVTGNVQLGGSVDSLDHKFAAERAVATVPGVRSVQNNLVVK